MEQLDNLRGQSVLVTGASGFLGRRLVVRLIEQGCLVRALVRNSSRGEPLRAAGAEIVVGDVTDLISLRPAFVGIDSVVHAAADTSGTRQGAERVTIGGTRNILGLCAAHRVRKLVYISSCAVYGLAGFAEGEVIAETASLESQPEARGNYSWGKCEAEKLVMENLVHAETAMVCLRPGMLYGPGGELYPPMLGFAFGARLFVVIDNGHLGLPLVHVDNLVEAIGLALVKESGNGKVYNVVDPELVGKRRYMDRLIRKLYPGALCLYLPYRWVYRVTSLQERLCAVLGRLPFLSCYRLRVSQQPIIYDTTRIRQDLGWRPLISFNEAAARLVHHAAKARGSHPVAGAREQAPGRKA